MEAIVLAHFQDLLPWETGRLPGLLQEARGQQSDKIGGQAMLTQLEDAACHSCLKDGHETVRDVFIEIGIPPCACKKQRWFLNPNLALMGVQVPAPRYTRMVT